MKILYLIYGTFNSGGMERVLCNKANWLVAHGYDITIITTDQQDKKSFFDFSTKIEMVDLGVNFTQTNGANIVSKTVQYLKKQRQYRKRLANYLSNHRADIVISMFGAETHWLPILKDGSRKLVEIHFSKYFREQQCRGGLWRLSDLIRSKQDEKAIKKYDRFVVLTNEDKGNWGDCSNIEVIHNASIFAPTAQAELHNKRVISVGRLIYQKGYDMLIDAWTVVAAQHPDWRLTIVGGGEELGQRQAQVKRLGLDGSVELIPPSSTIEREYLDSSIYALSSRYEGLPMVLLETMACGVPVVAFTCKCGPRDVITDGIDGLLVEDGSVQDLATGICKLIENDDLRTRMGAEAARTVRENFNEDKIMAQWVQLFNNLSSK